MNHSQRWSNWVWARCGNHTYLGKVMLGLNANDGFMKIGPCCEIVEQYPVVEGPGRQPVVFPVTAFVTIGMFGTDDIPMSIKPESVIYMAEVAEEKLAEYSAAYDKMLENNEKQREARQRVQRVITPPSGEDITRFGQGGDGEERH